MTPEVMRALAGLHAAAERHAEATARLDEAAAELARLVPDRKQYGLYLDLMRPDELRLVHGQGRDLAWGLAYARVVRGRARYEHSWGTALGADIRTWEDKRDVAAATTTEEE